MESDEQLYNRPDSDEAIIFRHNGQYVGIVLCDILFCEAEGNYTNVYLKRDPRLVIICKRIFLLRRILKKYNVFYQCHKSYIINLDEINSFCIENKNKMLRISDFKVPVARGTWKNILPVLLKKGLQETK